MLYEFNEYATNCIVYWFKSNIHMLLTEML